MDHIAREEVIMMTELYEIVEEGFYQQPWVQDISQDCCKFCEISGPRLFFYYEKEEEAHDAVAKCYKRHILTSAPIMYNRLLYAYTVTVVCYPTSDIFELKPRGDLSGKSPILD